MNAEMYQKAETLIEKSSLWVSDKSQLNTVIARARKLETEVQRLAEENEYLKATVKVYKACDELTKQHSKKVKHLFPLENTAGYGQLCDKILEFEQNIKSITDFEN